MPRRSGRRSRLLREVGGPGSLAAQGLVRGEPGDRRVLLGVVGVEHLTKLLAKLFDEGEFLSPYGLRALSAFHRDHPYELEVDGFRASIDYEPAESTTGMFGGNSNWRGPIWFPLNYLLISALERYHRFFGDELTVEYPTGGPRRTLDQVAADLRRRLVDLFVVGPDGRRPCFGVDRLQRDPAWSGNLVFNEYFHGDDGAGLGASHQTGWTGLVADLIRGRPSADGVYAIGDLGGVDDGHGRDRRRGRPGQGAPGQPLPARGDPEPWRDQLRGVVGRGRGDAAVSVRRRRRRDPGRPARVRRRGLARLRRGVGAGQAYGYRATGPWDPARGVRCNPAKLLLDPYARATTGPVRFGPEVLGHDADDPDRASRLDLGRACPPSLVVDPAFDWPDAAAARPWHRYADTVVYEVHVKGFTMGHPGVPPELRGTFAGLAHDAAVAHLVDLGVTAVELLPVHQHAPEAFLVERGLTNYWGYNTIGFFAPHDGYSAAVRAGRPGGQVAEFQAMVAALHAAGLEVLLDVVFNHTAEGGQAGPTLCHRGLDNPAYYRLDPADPRRYVDTTGTGNSLNAGDPVCLQLIMDSLRYWLTEMGVDGSASTSHPPWPARTAGSTGCRPSSTWSTRTRWCPRPS